MLQGKGNSMKRGFFSIGLILGLVGPVYANQTVVAGPLGAGLEPYDVVFCRATNLSSDEQTIRYGLVSAGSLVAPPAEAAVDSAKNPGAEISLYSSGDGTGCPAAYGISR